MNELHLCIDVGIQTYVAEQGHSVQVLISNIYQFAVFRLIFKHLSEIPRFQ